jgi:hypothetical protein
VGRRKAVAVLLFSWKTTNREVEGVRARKREWALLGQEGEARGEDPGGLVRAREEKEGGCTLKKKQLLLLL